MEKKVFGTTEDHQLVAVVFQFENEKVDLEFRLEAAPTDGILSGGAYIAATLRSLLDFLSEKTTSIDLEKIKEIASRGHYQEVEGLGYELSQDFFWQRRKGEAVQWVVFFDDSALWGENHYWYEETSCRNNLTIPEGWG